MKCFTHNKSTVWVKLTCWSVIFPNEALPIQEFSTKKYASPHSPCKITSPYKHWDIINPLHVEVKWPLVEISVWRKFYMPIKEMHVLVMTVQFNWRNRVDPECEPATFSHFREDLSLKSWQLCQNSLVAVKKRKKESF